MNNKEAIETIRSNWPPENYTMLREALEIAIDLIEADSKSHNKEGIMDFGAAIGELKNGNKVRRRGWNGKGIFIELQKPDENSKMTHSYIFIDTTGLQTDNEDAPKDRVPWLASQTDMLANDWELA